MKKRYTFRRRDKAPFPLEIERRGGLQEKDFGGTFEPDDGGHRVIERGGIISVADALSKGNWLGIAEDGESIVPEEEFNSPEGSFLGGVADLYGNRVFDVFTCLETGQIEVGSKINLAAMGFKVSHIDMTEARKSRQSRHY
jgi:hypothetical protein